MPQSKHSGGEVGRDTSRRLITDTPHTGSNLHELNIFYKTGMAVPNPLFRAHISLMCRARGLLWKSVSVNHRQVACGARGAGGVHHAGCCSLWNTHEAPQTLINSDINRLRGCRNYDFVTGTTACIVSHLACSIIIYTAECRYVNTSLSMQSIYSRSMVGL